MECREVKKNLSAYLDREMDPSLINGIEAHLQSCPDCLLESQQISKAWALLDLAPKIEPSPDYMSRFWTKVATQESVNERLLRGFKSLLGKRRLIPLFTVLSLMLMIGSTDVIQQINTDDVEMLQNIDLAEHFDTIKDLEVIRDLDTGQKESTT